MRDLNPPCMHSNDGVSYVVCGVCYSCGEHVDEGGDVSTLNAAAKAVHDATDALIAEYRSQLLDARSEAAALRRENDAMRQLFQVWLLSDSLSWQERAELARRTIAFGGEVARAG